MEETPEALQETYQGLSEVRPLRSYEWWRMRVLRQEGLEVASSTLVGELTKAYDVREAYERACRRKDPLLSPHGFFRALSPIGKKFFHHARDFLEAFGPLTMVAPPPYRGKSVCVNLSEFWLAQNQFCRVAQLYEGVQLYQNRKDSRPLRAALQAYYQQEPMAPAIVQYSKHCWLIAQASKLGGRALKPGDTVKVKAPSGEDVQVIEGLAKHFADEFQQRWLARSAAEQRLEALAIVEKEIQLHTSIPGSAYLLWRRWPERNGDRFHLSYHFVSLLSAIYDLFASDTTATPWRICPHCQKIFYSPRRDRFYCTSRQQVLASKHAYELRRVAERRRQKTRKENRR